MRTRSNRSPPTRRSTRMQNDKLEKETSGESRLALPESRTRFVKRYLNPADRLQEVLCGLIMVLDFTLIGGLTAGEGKHGVRHLLIAALGCNIAWGVHRWCDVRDGCL